MKTVLSIVSPEKAPKELKIFSITSFSLSFVSLFVFWWLAIAGAAAGGRALLLNFHKGAKNMEKLWLYRTLASVGLTIGAFSIIFFTIVK